MSINKNISSLKTFVENGSVFTENSYKYDLNGNQVEKLENGVTTTYEYDQIQQISKVSYGNGSKVESFAYDNVGNRLERTIETGSVLTKEKYSYDNKNRLQVLEKDNTKVTYLYDNQGNTLEEQHQDLTSKTTATTTYIYDGFNRNTKVITKDGNTQENYYDPMGLRTSVVRNGVTSSYVFRVTEVSHELDEDNNVKNREVRGYRLLNKETSNLSLESKVYYYLHNEHSDVTKSEEEVNNEFKYYEQQWDNETHLLYLRARYYNPTIGRFTQEDVYRGDGLNLYAYVKNNPIMWIDPSGYGRTKENKIKPNKNAQGAHTVFKTNDEGVITNYRTYEPNPRNPSGFDEVIGYDGIGASHTNKVTGEELMPHMHDENTPGGVRSPKPDELPKSARANICAKK